MCVSSMRYELLVLRPTGELYIFGGRDANSDYGSQELLKLSRKSGIWEVVENIGTWPERRSALADSSFAILMLFSCLSAWNWLPLAMPEQPTLVSMLACAGLPIPQ